MSSKWYLVYAKPQREAVAREQLAQQGYTVFLPMVKQKRRIRGKRATRLEPFFPRYLFISLNKTDDNWSPIRSTVGVINLVRFGGLPAQVPDSVVDFLLAREQESLIVHPTCDFSKGDTVRVVSGPFEGVEALFSSSASDERAMILLRLANQHTLAQVNLSSIERVV